MWPLWGPEAEPGGAQPRSVDTQCTPSLRSLLSSPNPAVCWGPSFLAQISEDSPTLGPLEAEQREAM